MLIQPKLCLLAVLTLAPAQVSFGQNPPGTGPDGDPGPPLFLTSPIESDVAPPGLEEGHFKFENGKASPAPLTRDLGAAAFRPAPHAGETQLAGSAPTVISLSGSYEGETGATSKSGLVVGGANHIYPGACNAAAAPGTVGDCAPLAFASSDGTTWTHTSLPRVWNGTSFGIGFDPAIDVDKSGTFYYSYGVAPLSGNYPNGIVVVKSVDGVNWTQLTPVTFNTSKYFDDKYWIAVDRSNSVFANRVYVAWDRNTSINQILEVSYSSNGGASWTGPIKVNDGTSNFERVIGAYPAVDQNTGTVYVSWHDYSRNRIYVDKSTNGGASWGTDRQAAVTHTGFGQDIGCVGGRSQSPAHHLKVGPSGALYLVYADAVSGRGYDILLTKSTNGGASWSPPITLNDDPGNSDQFHPTLSVESNGAGGDLVTVTFYDRRDDSNDCLAHVYATESADSGVTWAANVKVTTSASNFDGNPNGPGDYSSSTPSALGRFPFFSVHPPNTGAGAFDVATVQLTSSPPPPPTTDLAVTAVSAPSSVIENTLTPVTVTVQNLGTTTGSFNVSLTDDKSSTITPSSQSVSVGAGSTLDVNFNWTPTVTSVHTLTGANTSPDGNAANDTLTAASNVTSGAIAPPPDVSAISPVMITAGSSSPMTITGTGFAAGASVSFANGTGPAPSASVSSVSADGTTISGIVSASSGGPKGNRVWDVVVTNSDGQSDTLAGGFTVHK